MMYLYRGRPVEVLRETYVRHNQQYVNIKREDGSLLSVQKRRLTEQALPPAVCQVRDEQTSWLEPWS